LALEQRREFGQRHNITYLSQQPELTVLRSEVDWLKAVPVHALQRAVDHAFQRFFASLGGYPKSRKKFKDDSFTLPDPRLISVFVATINITVRCEFQRLGG
jgi:putative transposase